MDSDIQYECFNFQNPCSIVCLVVNDLLQDKIEYVCKRQIKQIYYQNALSLLLFNDGEDAGECRLLLLPGVAGAAGGYPGAVHLKQTHAATQLRSMYFSAFHQFSTVM